MSDSNETDPAINKENAELLRRPEVFGMRSRKVYDSLNSENRNRAHPWRTKNWLGAGCSKFLHVNCRNVHVPPVRPHVAEKRTFQQTGRKRKQPKTLVPPQRFSVQQRCKNNVAPLKNSVRPLQQR